MMNNNLNWVGNKVIDTNASRLTSRSAYTAPKDSAAGYSAPAPEAQKADSAYTAPSKPVINFSASILEAQRDGNGMIDPPMMQQGPPPSTEVGYIPYYLASNIGKNMRAEFIIGSSQYAEKTGKLLEVGINYFVLDDVNSRTHVMCDLYSVKFVTVLQF